MKKSKVIFSILAIFLLTTFTVSAHDWYSQACCHNQDCAPIDCTEIVEKSKGYMEWSGWSFSPEQIHPSEDNKCHACIHDFPDGKRPLCLYIQQGS